MTDEELARERFVASGEGLTIEYSKDSTPESRKAASEFWAGVQEDFEEYEKAQKAKSK